MFRLSSRTDFTTSPPEHALEHQNLLPYERSNIAFSSVSLYNGTGFVSPAKSTDGYRCFTVGRMYLLLSMFFIDFPPL